MRAIISLVECTGGRLRGLEGCYLRLFVPEPREAPDSQRKKHSHPENPKIAAGRAGVGLRGLAGLPLGVLIR